YFYNPDDFKERLLQKESHDHETDVKFVRIEPANGPNGFLVTSDNERYNTLHPDLFALKEVLNGVCNYLNVYEQNLRDKEKSEFLFNCASRFYTINRKSKILKEIIHALQRLYPKFTYYLFLSQDSMEDKKQHIIIMKFIEYTYYHVINQ